MRLIWLTAACGLLACRDPTQVTLEISTNADCPGEPRTATMILETGIVAGVPAVASDPNAAPNTTTSACDNGEIGSIILYPEGGATEAGALVIGRLHREDDPGSIERCIAFANTEPVPGEEIDGGNCIIARRRVAFIDHVPLRLPVRLELACAGIRCAPDKTCVPGAPPDETGLPCVSATVTCDAGGDCETPQGTGGSGAGGDGGAGGAGGRGDGGAGGAGGSSQVTVTPIEPSLAVEQVAGLESNGEVYVLDITPQVGTKIYRLVGDMLVDEFGVQAAVSFTSSRRFQVIDGNLGPVFGWDHDGAVRIEGDGSYTPLPFYASFADFSLVDSTQALIVEGTGSVYLQTYSQRSTACMPNLLSEAFTVTQSGGAIFTAGDKVCTCTTCSVGPGGFRDIAGLPGFGVAVAVSPSTVVSIQAGGAFGSFALLPDAAEGELNRVHVTGAGALWVASSIDDELGGTYIARSTVDATGDFDTNFISASPQGLGGIKSLWAVDSPAPAAYVVTNAGKLYRIEGL